MVRTVRQRDTNAIIRLVSVRQYRKRMKPALGRPFVKRFALCHRAVVLSVLCVTLVYCGQTVDDQDAT